MKHIGACLLASIILVAQILVLTGIPERASAYTPHASIFINGNSGFNASNGVTGGDGTSANPFIIEGWDINSTATTGIGIRNTNAYFIIRDVFVHGGSPFSSPCIHLQNVTNARIENSSLADSYAGIIVDYHSSSIVVKGNNMSSHWDMGLYSETNLTVEDNTFYGNGRGLFLYSGATVRNNIFLWNKMTGINLAWGSFGGTIIDNVIEWNGWTSTIGGIFFENESAYWTISHNRISHNNQSGIFMNGIGSLIFHNVTIEYNEISYNVGKGIHMGWMGNTTRDITIRHNNFIGNSVPQADDDSGTVNHWDDGCSGGGNYWSDYTGGDSIDCNTGMAGSDGYGDTPYVLDSDSQDNYPFMNPVNLSWNNTAPTVTVTSPNGGESWAGGSVQDINWTMNDDSDSYLTVWIQYQVDGGVWEAIPGAQNMYMPVGNRSFSWTVPQVNTSNALVRVIVMDSGGLTWNDQSDDFFAIYPVGPYIVSTDPLNGSVDIPLDKWIVVTFNEQMNVSSVTVQFLQGSPVPLTQSWTVGDKVLTLTHTMPFTGCMIYSIKIYGNDIDGNSLVPGPVPNPFWFRTACLGPSILTTEPMDGQTGVALDAYIVVLFSTAMNETSVDAAIYPDLPLSPSWSMNGTMVTYNHTTSFAGCTNYTVNVTGNDVNGYPLIPGLVPNPWSFRTGCLNPVILSTDPADGETNVPLNASIIVVFSNPMNRSSVSLVLIPTLSYSATWSMNDAMVVYTHASPFADCQNYTASITGKDYSGYPLIPGPVPNPWTFSTCVFNPPSVSLINPVGGEDWTGGYVKTLEWNVTDPDDVLSNLTTYLWWSWDGGTGWGGIASGLPGTTLTYDWLVPFFNTTFAKIQVCAKDPMNNTGCGYSGLFTIDSASPQVSSTVPPNGATDVPLNTTIVVYWNEKMDTAKGMFTFTPPVPGSSNWSAGGDMVWFSPSVLLSICTNYSVTLTGFADDSDPGNTMAAPYSFNFMTYCPGPPSLSLLAPLGGEYWAGGSTHQVTWSVTDDNTPSKNITIFINYTSSVSSGPIAGPITIVTAYPWILPTIDATDVKVNITAIDSDSMASWDESGYLTIDSTPPSLTAYSPQGWNVPLGSFVKATFSEPVDAQSGNTAAAFGLRDETTGKWANIGWTRLPPTWPQEIHYIPTAQLQTCRAYRAMVNSSYVDRASWPLTNSADWTFHTVCAPSVSGLTSLAGKDWSGGSSHDVSWTMSDEVDTQLRVWLNYSRNGGADGYPYPVAFNVLAVGAKLYSWPVPRVDTTGARLRVTVMDSSGLKAVAESGDFTIDSTPPSVMSSVPLNGSGGVTITDTVQIVFTEPIVRATAEAAFSISPDPGGVTLSWSTTMTGKDILVVSHKPFKQKTDYKVTIGTFLRDDSDPGNHPASSLWVRFSTKPPVLGPRPVALAVGKNQVAVGELVTLDGSGSIGTNLTYIWTIIDNQNNIVDVLAGKIATFTFQKNGRYRVVLTVVDMTTAQSDADEIEIVVTSSDVAGAAILLSATIIGGALIAGTEVGRVAFFMLLAVPVYRRKMRGKDDSLGRGMVLGYIMVHPGDTYTDIKRNLDLNDGTLTWHLSKLEKEEMIKSKVKGVRRHYYPSSMPLPFEDGGELHEIEKLLIEAVRSDPGRSVKLLAEELAVSSQLALYHLRKLAQKGNLRLERKGLSLRVYPAKDRNS